MYSPSLLGIYFALAFFGSILMLLLLGIVKLPNDKWMIFILDAPWKQGFVLVISILTLIVGVDGLIEGGLLGHRMSSPSSLIIPAINQEEIPLTNWRAQINPITAAERYPTQITTISLGSQTITALQAQNVELRSSQSQEGYTNLGRSLSFMASKPITDKPISGVTAYVFIEPDEASRNQKIFCRFVAQYRLDTGSAEIYTSADKFVPVNQWHPLLWDLTAGLEATGKSWESDWSELSDNLGRESQHFTSLSRRLSEQLLYNAANEARGTGVANWQSRFEELGVQCFVSAHQLYGTGINPVFRGNIYLSNVNTYPVDFIGSP